MCEDVKRKKKLLKFNKILTKPGCSTRSAEGRRKRHSIRREGRGGAASGTLGMKRVELRIQLRRQHWR